MRVAIKPAIARELLLRHRVVHENAGRKRRRREVSLEPRELLVGDADADALRLARVEHDEVHAAMIERIVERSRLAPRTAADRDRSDSRDRDCPLHGAPWRDSARGAPCIRRNWRRSFSRSSSSMSSPRLNTSSGRTTSFIRSTNARVSRGRLGRELAELAVVACLFAEVQVGHQRKTRSFDKTSPSVGLGYESESPGHAYNRLILEQVALSDARSLCGNDLAALA